MSRGPLQGGMSNTAKAKRTVQSHTEFIDTPKPTIIHWTALQRDEIQLHQPEHRHKSPHPGNHHRIWIQPLPQRQTPQLRITMTLRTFFFLFTFKSNCLFPISTFTLHLLSAVVISSHFFFFKKINNKGERSQDGRGIGWGDHFLPYKFTKISSECWATSTKQLLNAGRGHQAPRKACHPLQKEVGQNIKDKKRDERVRDENPSGGGSYEGEKV